MKTKTVDNTARDLVAGTGMTRARLSMILRTTRTEAVVALIARKTTKIAHRLNKKCCAVPWLNKTCASSKRRCLRKLIQLISA